MRIPLPGSRQIGLWGGRGLWVRSTNTRIVPDDGFKRTDDRDLTFLTLSAAKSGDCRLEAGLGTSIWVTLEVQAGVTATADGNLNNATQRGTYENIDAAAVTRHFHGGRAGIELLGGLSRGYMRWLEIIDGHAVRESSGPPPGVKPVKASFPWKSYSDRPKLLVLRQGFSFPQAGSEQLRNYYLEVWWLAEGDTEYQVLEGHAKRAEYGDQIGYGIAMRPFCGDLVLFEQMKRELAAAVVQGAITLVVSAAAWRQSVTSRTTNVGSAGPKPIPRGLISKGATPPGMRQSDPDPFTGTTSGVTARAGTTRSLRTGIDASGAEFESFKQAVFEKGEIGIQSPGHANVSGVDFVTARRGAGGKMEVLLNDATLNPNKVPKTTPPSTWVSEARDAVAPGRLDLGDAALEQEVRDAVTAGQLRVRTLTVNLTPQGTVNTVGW
jgi:hypothetical protein